MLNYEDIRQVHFEPTQKCQASCPMCDRNKNGGDVNQYLENVDINLEQFKKIFPPDFLAQLKSFFHCGNHGDPILCPDLIPICKYIRECNPKIYMWMSTNGGARNIQWWTEIAPLLNYCQFSVDGLWDTNHLYRQGVVWDRVEENMEAFIEAGGRAEWTFLVFSYNEHQVEEARQYAKLMGVDKFIVKKSGRYIHAKDTKGKEEHPVLNRKNQKTHMLGKPKDPKYRNKATDGVYQQIVEKFGSLEVFIEGADIKPKCIEKNEIYVSAEGHVMPCCWLHGQIYNWLRPMSESDVWQLIQKTGGLNNINALIVPLQDAVESMFFDAVEASWEIKGCAQGRLKTCGMKCNVGFDPFKAQWQ